MMIEACDEYFLCVCTHIGYLSDPDDIPGMAHFCEHMLFLGTEKVREMK